MSRHIHHTKEGLVIDRSVEAVLYDFDGTIMDNTKPQGLAWIELAQKYNKALDMEAFRARFTGKTSRYIIRELFGELPSGEVDFLYAERLELYKKIARETAKEIPGFSKLFTSLGDAGIKLALVTSGSKPTRDFQLGLFDLERRLDCIVGSEDVANIKPHPEPYQAALRHLGVQAANSIVFEDSPTGVQSAVAADIPTIGILSGYTRNELAGVAAATPDYTTIKLSD